MANTILSKYVENILEVPNDESTEAVNYYNRARSAVFNNMEPTEEEKELIKLFPSSIHSQKLIDEQEKIEQNVTDLAWGTFRFNPLKFRTLLVEALARFERCLSYEEAHRNLQIQAINVLERIETRRNIRLKEIETQISILDDELSDAQKLINHAVEGLSQNEKVKDSFVDLLQIQEESRENRESWARNLYYDDQTKLDASKRLERDSINRETPQIHSQIASAKAATAAGKANEIIAKLQNSKVSKLLELEKQLKTEEEKLAEKVEDSYLEHGPLAFLPQFKVIAGYYLNDFKMAYERLVLANFGLQFVHNEVAQDNLFEPTRNISSALLRTRKILDDLDAIENNRIISTIRFRLNSLLSSDNLVKLKNGEVVKFEFDFNSFYNTNTFINQIECYFYDSLEETVQFKLTPPTQQSLTTLGSVEIQPKTLVLSAQPTDSRIQNAFDSNSVINTKLDGKWSMEAKGTISNPEKCEFIISISMFRI